MKDKFMRKTHYIPKDEIEQALSQVIPSVSNDTVKDIDRLNRIGLDQLINTLIEIRNKLTDDSSILFVK